MLLDRGISSGELKKVNAWTDKYYCLDECGNLLVDIRSNPGSRCNYQVACCVLDNGSARQAMKIDQLPAGARIILGYSSSTYGMSEKDKIVLGSIRDVYLCLDSKDRRCAERVVTETTGKFAKLDRDAEDKKRAEAEKMIVEQRAAELKKYRDEAASAWKTANDVLAWVTKEDKGPGGITPKYVQQIIARYIYLKDANPATVEEAKRYAELGRAMLAEIATDKSAIKGIKEEGFGLRSCYTKDTTRIDCDRGYKIREDMVCTLVSGITYEKSHYSDYSCYDKPEPVERPTGLGIRSMIDDARDRSPKKKK